MGLAGADSEPAKADAVAMGNEIFSQEWMPNDCAATAATGLVTLWDLAEGESRGTLTGHTQAVRRVIFSPDGKTLATGGGGRTVRLWDVGSRPSGPRSPVPKG